MSNVHLNNKYTHKEILHCETQDICMSILMIDYLAPQYLQCFEDDCYRDNNKMSHKILLQREADG